MTREIVLDTETTGFEPIPQGTDRIVEIGCVELQDRVMTGREFHCYLNPERAMPEAAFRVHGLSDAFLQDKPGFAAIADAFLDFIGDAPLVIHNAGFDVSFLNGELEQCQYAPIPARRGVDTLAMARRKFPGQSASLDALCSRFAIDLTQRDKHGALIDARLLAMVYLELTGGRQVRMALDQAGLSRADLSQGSSYKSEQFNRPHAPSEAELIHHRDFLDQLHNPLWHKYTDGEA
ncbi:MAG: DNA polymerase III subunit epsilon [Pseudomonadota bacterium]